MSAPSPELIAEMLVLIAGHDEAEPIGFRARQRLFVDLQLDENTIVAKLGVLQVRPLAFAGKYFDTAIRGVEPELGVLVAVLDECERWQDLVAWPLAAPRRLATLLGRVAMIGEHNLDVFAPLGHRVAVHRDAIAWLRAGCVGVVPIDPQRAARRFLDLDGELIAEDVEHAADLAAARADLVDMAPKIMVFAPAEANNKRAA